MDSPREGGSRFKAVGMIKDLFEEGGGGVKIKDFEYIEIWTLDGG